MYTVNLEFSESVEWDLIAGVAFNVSRVQYRVTPWCSLPRGAHDTSGIEPKVRPEERRLGPRGGLIQAVFGRRSE